MSKLVFLGPQNSSSRFHPKATKVLLLSMVRRSHNRIFTILEGTQTRIRLILDGHKNITTRQEPILIIFLPRYLSWR